MNILYNVKEIERKKGQQLLSLQKAASGTIFITRQAEH
jgi:hypothetical protein